MSLYRYDPPPGAPALEGFARATSDGPVVCRSCGCRLEAPAAWLDGDRDANPGWHHFEGLPGRDARGCRVACVDLAHGRDGRLLG
jgi:hypothetical protein